MLSNGYNLIITVLSIKRLEKQITLCFTLLTLVNDGFKSFKSKRLLV